MDPRSSPRHMWEPPSCGYALHGCFRRNNSRGLHCWVNWRLSYQAARILKNGSHASIPDAIAAIRILALNQHVAVDFTEDAAAFTDANLSQDAAVVFLLTTGEVLTQISRRPLSGTSTMVVDTLACTLPAIPNTTGPGMGNWLAPTLIVCMDTPKWCRRLSTSLIAHIHPL